MLPELSVRSIGNGPSECLAQSSRSCFFFLALVLAALGWLHGRTHRFGRGVYGRFELLLERSRDTARIDRRWFPLQLLRKARARTDRRFERLRDLVSGTQCRRNRPGKLRLLGGSMPGRSATGETERDRRAPSSGRFARVFLRCKLQASITRPARAGSRARGEDPARASRPACARSDMGPGGTQQTFPRDRATSTRRGDRRRAAVRRSPDLAVSGRRA